MTETFGDLAAQGMTIAEIAERMGSSYRVAQRRVRELVLAGTVPPASERRVASRTAKRGPVVMVTYMAHRHGLKMGWVSDILTALSPEQIDWLGKTVPEGLTLAEFCAAVLRDLHDEETTLPGANHDQAGNL
jgi:transposase